MILGGERQNPRPVDEAWSVYVGEELNRECPNSLAATALKREGNFGREGAIDVPLPEAMTEAQQAAADMDDAAYSTVAPNVYSRFDAIFYLSTVRYMNEALKHAHDGDNNGAGVAMVEGLSSTYRLRSTLPRPMLLRTRPWPPASRPRLRPHGGPARRSADRHQSDGIGFLLTQADLVTSFE